MSLCGVLVKLVVNVVLLCAGSCGCVISPAVVVNAGVLLNCVYHGEALPGLAYSYFLALIGNGICAAYIQGNCAVKLLDEIHHAEVIGICLVHFNGSELRVVGSVHALVAEYPADLVYLVEAAYDKAL